MMCACYATLGVPMFIVGKAPPGISDDQRDLFTVSRYGSRREIGIHVSFVIYWSKREHRAVGCYHLSSFPLH